MFDSYSSVRTSVTNKQIVNNITTANPSGIFQRKSLYSRIQVCKYGDNTAASLFFNTPKLRVNPEEISEKDEPLYSRFKVEKYQQTWESGRGHTNDYTKPKVLDYYLVPVMVLQVVNSNEGYVLVEYLLEPDFDKMVAE